MVRISKNSCPKTRVDLSRVKERRENAVDFILAENAKAILAKIVAVVQFEIQ